MNDPRVPPPRRLRPILKGHLRPVPTKASLGFPKAHGLAASRLQLAHHENEEEQNQQNRQTVEQQHHKPPCSGSGS